MCIYILFNIIIITITLFEISSSIQVTIKNNIYITFYTLNMIRIIICQFCFENGSKDYDEMYKDTIFRGQKSDVCKS